VGLTLNEYGLFPEDDEKTPPQQRGIEPVAGATEEEIFHALNLAYVPPEMREDRGEVDLAEKAFAGAKTKAAKHAAAPVDGLIELADIKAELHAHTTASDGRLSIEELATDAKSRGFHTIAVTDHSKSSVIANGLSPERLRVHVAAIHAARKQVKGVHILAGSEVDILADGSLDYDADTLALLDVVVGSPHNALSQEPEVATKRLIRAIESGKVHILGHPTGRLINRRAGLSPDMAKIIAAAKVNDVAMEINSHWMRLDLRDVHVRAAVDAGCLIAIDCDVHAADDFDNLRFGVATARRGWLPAEQCVNTWTAEKLLKWLKRK
jgi:DNA polymerase (family 10)